MSITSIPSQFSNFFKSKIGQPFIIYEIDALTAKTPSELAQYAAIQFDAVYRYGYRNEARVPYQPLENGSYTIDSVLDTPFILKVTGVISMIFNNSVVYDYSSIEDITDTLLEYLQNQKQIIIFKNQPFFTIYNPMHMIDFQYDVTPDNITLYADMVFQQTRTASIGTISTGQPVLSNQNKLTNPTNVNIHDNGIVAPNTNPNISETLVPPII